ncbi:MULTISPECIES: DUF4270 domain-containing protein [Bacteroides]|jgi:hypothetical protein|uniref:DUF4270 domain-containing protein n=1 Tax=Bacteroides TaxID=816 RepID=UPI00117D61C8|nr:MULTISPECIES: DUF4270 domain-containing protein [Bacteroides]
MKAKYALIALLAITFFGCDDNTAGLGLGMFPGSDQNINGKLTTFDVTTESVHAGKIYAMSNIGYVGKFTDETFGTYQAGFLAELNCPKGTTFPGIFNYDKNTAFDNKNKLTQTMVGEGGNAKDKEDITFVRDENDKIIGNIHTIELYLWYDSYFGDSLTASRLSVYELGDAEKELNENNAYYTDINPEEFYTPQNLLGTKAYTAVDLSVKDSIRNLSTYVPSVHVSFKDDAAIRIGREIIQHAYKAGTNFDNKAFREAFKGIYVKSDYGDGTILYINQIQMNVVYKSYAIDTIKGTILPKTVVKDGESPDSTYYGYRMFTSTREVIQANQLKNDNTAIQDCIKKDGWTYLKSPAGIFTQITLPINKIADQLQGDTLNAVKLGIPIYNETNDRKFGMSIPKSVLLIRNKYKDSFFKNNQLSDGITSSLFDYSSSTSSLTQYTFNNITQMINNCLADKEAAERDIREKGFTKVSLTDPEGNVYEENVDNIEKWEELIEWDKFVLIPVLVTKDASSNSYYSSSNVISIQHDLKPGYARLKGGSKGNQQDPQGNPLYPDNVLKLEVISTSFGTKSK